MGYIVGERITDSVILRDGVTPIAGLDIGDFATAECRLVDVLPSVTTPLTVQYVSGGMYDIAFTPDRPGTWQVHLLYSAGPVFKEVMGTYDIDASASSDLDPGIVNGLAYTTVERLRGQINIDDNDDDLALQQTILAASREIDGMTNRRFYQLSQVRTFTPVMPDLLVTGDIVSVNAITTDAYGQRTYDDAWTLTDYDLGPEDAIYQGWPYTEIRTSGYGDYEFPIGQRSIRIDGVWGWPSVPIAIQQATLLLAVRLWQRHLAPFGTAGTLPDGQVIYVPKNDPDVKVLVQPFVWYQPGPF